jgi:2'-5' RNA ligase
MRCFVAVDLSAEVRAAVAEVQARVRAAAPNADVRWLEPHAFHLTLKFLGAVPDERVVAVSAALERVVSGPPLDLEARGLGAFPTIRRPHVLWAGIAVGAPRLVTLAADVERALVPLGFPPEARPFQAHLTVGRVRSPRDAGVLAKAIAVEGAVALGAWTASEVVLYQSHLKPTGAVHEKVSRHRLRGAST